MASACVNNVASSSSSSSFGWFSSPVSLRMSPVHEEEKPSSADNLPTETESSTGDFEFCLEHSGAMLTADELFFDGKLLPLHRPAAEATVAPPQAVVATECGRRSDESSTAAAGIDMYLSSPKAPRCSSRWKEMLGFKKMYQNRSTTESTTTAAAVSKAASSTSNSKSIRHFLHRSSKSTTSSTDSFLNLPLLKDDQGYYDAAALLPARLSLSSSSSSSSSSGSHDFDDLPRLSLDSDRPHSRSLHRHPTRMRQVNSRLDNNPSSRNQIRRTPTEPAAGIAMDSPRMNSSGKVIFQNLVRSSSSPSSFHGGLSSKHRGGCMERTYSSGVRVTPVLNVPVSSLLGSSSSKSGGSAFGQLFSSSPQKRSESTAIGTSSRRTHYRTDRNPKSVQLS